MVGSRLRQVSCLGLAMMFLACGDDKASDPDGTVADVAETAAPDGTSDATNTPDGEVASTLCTSDTECTGGAICDCHGACVAPGTKACTEDRNCGVPNWCNTCTGFCEAQVGVCELCSESRGCLDQGQCLPYASGDYFCGLGCVTDAGCPDGFSCLSVAGVAVKQCVAKSGACGDLGLCQGDSECPVGQICSDATRQCAPGCVEDGQCQEGTVCVSGRCVPPCAGNGDCTAPAECDDGKCKVPGACDAAADCPTPATYCSRVTGQCEPGCQVTADCKDAGKLCEGSVCVDKGCEHNFECAFGQVCNKASGECVPFPTSEQHCATCSAEGDPTGCNEGNECVRFTDAEDNPKGDFCIVPCANDPIDRCPSGWQCTAVEDPEGGAEQFFCVRQCYVNPVGTNP